MRSHRDRRLQRLAHRQREFAGLVVACLLPPFAARAIEFTQVTSDPAGQKSWNSEPAWSPDGKRIAYTHAVLTTNNEFTTWIEVLDLEHAKHARFPGQDAGDKPLANAHASWSPDGTRLVIAAASGILLTSPGSRDPSYLVRGALTEPRPSWSPDGKWIAFESEETGVRTLLRLPPLGGQPETISPPKGPMSGASWSPDGARVACAVWGEKGRDLWIVPVQGGTWRSLTRDAAEDFAPAWSPDGSTLAFVSNRSGNRDIWLVAVQGGEPVQLTQDPGDDLDPSWSPDGKRLAFASTRSGTLQIWLASDLPPARFLQRSWRAPKSVER